MPEQRWLVVRCPSCLRCMGHRSMPNSCMMCGQPIPRSAEVVAEVESAAQLQQAVALANTPEELREELTLRMGMGDVVSTRDRSMAATFTALREAAQEGIISLNDILEVLRSLDVLTPPSEFMEVAEHEGLVLRLGDGRWRFIE